MLSYNLSFKKFIPISANNYALLKVFRSYFLFKYPEGADQGILAHTASSDMLILSRDTFTLKKLKDLST